MTVNGDTESAEEGVRSSELFDQKMTCLMWLWEDNTENLGAGGTSPFEANGQFLPECPAVHIHSLLRESS